MMCCITAMGADKILFQKRFEFGKGLGSNLIGMVFQILTP